jgi:hypothetical protein
LFPDLEKMSIFNVLVVMPVKTRIWKTGLVSVLAAAGLVLLPGMSAAQGAFEGVITATTIDDGARNEQIMHFKGPRSRIEMNFDGERGTIIRDGNGRLLSLIDETRQYMLFPELSDDDDDASRFVATGQSETVAGYSCQYYRIEDPTGIQDGDLSCITTALGFVGFGGTGPIAAAEERAIRAQFKDGFMVLKTLDAGGVTEFEVTRVERTAVSDALFEIPPDYTEFTVPGAGFRP